MGADPIIANFAITRFEPCGSKIDALFVHQRVGLELVHQIKAILAERLPIVRREVGRAEAREEIRKPKEKDVRMALRILRRIIAECFPQMKVPKKINRIRDVVLLQQLSIEVLKAKDAAAMRKRLDEAIKSQDQ